MVVMVGYNGWLVDFMACQPLLGYSILNSSFLVSNSMVSINYTYLIIIIYLSKYDLKYSNY